MQKAQHIPAAPEGEETDRVHVDLTLMPDTVRNTLAAATLDLIHGILRQPGGREALDARTAARHAAQTAR